jgi:phosphatidylinositol kinase/protein kinase (PI-3  family)
VRDAALPYLEHDSPDVRKEAVLASTQLFINDPICHQTSNHSIEIVSDVLEKLLTVGITDPSEWTTEPFPLRLTCVSRPHHQKDRAGKLGREV